MGITESHHGKNGETQWLPIRKKKDGATEEREGLEVGGF
jgi:hypothetical protein